MEIVWTRTEGANNESVTLEGLMNRRRLVHATYDGLEIHDVERPRIEISVPPDDVERMAVENELIDSIVLLHVEGKIPLLIVRVQSERASNVALRIRRTLYELPELVP